MIALWRLHSQPRIAQTTNSASDESPKQVRFPQIPAAHDPVRGKYFLGSLPFRLGDYRRYLPDDHLAAAIFASPSEQVLALVRPADDHVAHVRGTPDRGVASVALAGSGFSGLG